MQQALNFDIRTRKICIVQNRTDVTIERVAPNLEGRCIGTEKCSMKCTLTHTILSWRVIYADICYINGIPATSDIHNARGNNGTHQLVHALDPIPDKFNIHVIDYYFRLL